MTFTAKGTKVWSYDGKQAGETTGSEHHCQMEGCRGVRVGVRWPEGKYTYPCSKGLVELQDHSLRIA